MKKDLYDDKTIKILVLLFRYIPIGATRVPCDGSLLLSIQVIRAGKISTVR